MWIDLRPPRGVETDVLEYSLYQLGAHRTGLRLDSQVIWLPPRTSDTLVPSSDRRATISLNSFATAVGTRSLRLRPGTRLRRLIELLNRLATVPPDSYALGCDDVISSYAISFHADTRSPANAEVSGQIGCPQLNLRVGGHHIQLIQAALVSEILALLHLTAAELNGPGR
jgi:hypothetical protein